STGVKSKRVTTASSINLLASLYLIDVRSHLLALRTVSSEASAKAAKVTSELLRFADSFEKIWSSLPSPNKVMEKDVPLLCIRAATDAGLTIEWVAPVWAFFRQNDNWPCKADSIFWKGAIDQTGLGMVDCPFMRVDTTDAATASASLSSLEQQT